MAIAWDELAALGIGKGEVERAVAEHDAKVSPRLERLWAYYRNPARGVARSAWPSIKQGRNYTQAQEQGLPTRLTGVRGGVRGSEVVDERARGAREIVIENDIAWRVQAMVDFVFGKPVLIQSAAKSQATRRIIERLLDHVWERSGGIALLQDMATLGHVYGHVDVALRVDEERLMSAGAALAMSVGSEVSSESEAFEDLLRIAGEAFRVELIEPTRGIAVLDDRDYRAIRAYIVRTHAGTPRSTNDPGLLTSLLKLVGGSDSKQLGGSNELLEVITSDAWHTYEEGELVGKSEMNLLRGEMPVVHVQNISQPFEYEGISEVEALIPLQDELNTRLSDRASRVTLQSFKMYLAKGIEGFDKVAVGPGQVWYTDNMDASITSFGGDGSSPSEDEHIREVREAMDKVSGVPPLSGGVVQGRIGNLSSANALKVTLMGLLAKTDRKRVAYGRAITELSRMMLVALHESGVFKTAEADRVIKLVWPDPLPIDGRDVVATATAKQELGVSKEKVLAELGYVGDGDAGVT